MRKVGKLIILVVISLGMTFFSRADSGLRMYIAGQVVDKDTGKGISWVGIWLNRSTWEFPNAQTDQDGKFIIRDVRAGRYHIIAMDFSRGYVTSRIYPSSDIEVKEGKNVWVKIEMEKGGEIVGRVVDRDGLPVVTRFFDTQPGDTLPPLGDLVELECKEIWRYSKTDSEGRFRLRGVPRGEECTLTADFSGYLIYKEKIILKKGEDRKEVTIVLGQGKADLYFDVKYPDGSRPEKLSASLVRLRKDFPLEELLSDYSIGTCVQKYCANLRGLILDKKGEEELVFKGYPPGIYLVYIHVYKTMADYLYKIRLKPGKNEYHFILDWEHLHKWNKKRYKNKENWYKSVVRKKEGKPKNQANLSSSREENNGQCREQKEFSQVQLFELQVSYEFFGGVGGWRSC